MKRLIVFVTLAAFILALILWAILRDTTTESSEQAVPVAESDRAVVVRTVPVAESDRAVVRTVPVAESDRAVVVRTVTAEKLAAGFQCDVGTFRVQYMRSMPVQQLVNDINATKLAVARYEDGKMFITTDLLVLMNGKKFDSGQPLTII